MLSSPWLQNGAEATIKSFGSSLRFLLSPPYEQCGEFLVNLLGAETVSFLETLPLHLSLPGVSFVHAGLRPGVPVEAQDPFDPLWIRSPFLEEPRSDNLLVVHGHTPVTELKCFLGVSASTRWPIRPAC